MGHIMSNRRAPICRTGPVSDGVLTLAALWKGKSLFFATSAYISWISLRCFIRGARLFLSRSKRSRHLVPMAFCISSVIEAARFARSVGAMSSSDSAAAGSSPSAAGSIASGSASSIVSSPGSVAIAGGYPLFVVGVGLRLAQDAVPARHLDVGLVLGLRGPHRPLHDQKAQGIDGVRQRAAVGVVLG